MNCQNFHLDELEFLDNSLYYRVYTNTFLVLGFPPPRTVGLRGQDPWGTRPSLSTLGKAIGFNTPLDIGLLKFHDRRMILYQNFLRGFLFLVYVPFIILLILFLDYATAGL